MNQPAEIILNYKDLIDIISPSDNVRTHCN